jgi:hypothetical protein
MRQHLTERIEIINLLASWFIICHLSKDSTHCKTHSNLTSSNLQTYEGMTEELNLMDSITKWGGGEYVEMMED